MPIGTVAGAAGDRIDRRSGAGSPGPHRQARRLAHGRDPWHVARVDVQRRGFWIDRRPTPLTAAVESRQHDAALTTRRREEDVSQRAETLLLLCHIGRPYRLARKRGGLHGKRLRGPRALAAQIRCRDAALHDVEQWSARLPIEQKDESTLGDLRDRIDPHAAARDRDETWCRGQITVPEIV